MSDNDLIRRGDALASIKVALNNATGDLYDAYSAIAALPAVTVGVKPLVWTGPRKLDEGGAAYDAHTTCGQYIATDTGWFLVGRSGWLVATSLETAKAAAQADYEARILAALEPVAAPDPAAIREAALRKVADKVYAKLSAKGLYAEAQSTRDTILALLEKPHDRA